MDVAGDLQIDCFTVYELACRLICVLLHSRGSFGPGF